MSKLLLLAAAAAAAATVFAKTINDGIDDEPETCTGAGSIAPEETAPPATSPATPTTGKRGRPSNASKAAAETPAAETAATETPAATVKGKTYDELRAIVVPIVKGSKGLQNDIKKLMERLGAADLTALAAMPEKHEEFESELAMLTM